MMTGKYWMFFLVVCRPAFLLRLPLSTDQEAFFFQRGVYAPHPMVDVSRGLLVVCAVLDSLQFSTLVSKCKLHGDRYHFCQFGNGKSCFCFMMVLYVPTRKWFRWMSFWEQLQIFSGWDSCCASTVPAWSENKRFSVVFPHLPGEGC